MNKILIVGPAWVGDMVMAQSLFKLIKQTRTHCEIDVLAPAWSLPILARMREVSQAFIMPIGHGKLNLLERLKIGKKIRNHQYQQAIVLPNSFKSALIPWFARIPVRTGWVGECRFGILNDYRKLNKKKYHLMIERFMALGLNANANLSEPYPFPELIVTKKSQQDALKKFQLMLANKKILALCPGAEFGPAKRWPEKYYAEVANKKLAEGWDVWIFGSAKDQIVAANIMEQTQGACIDLCGKTNLEEAIDLLSMVDFVISNDSGLMHIAAALQKEMFVVYGPTAATFTPPLSKKAKIFSEKLACQPCFQRQCPLQHNQCMQSLTPQILLHAMHERNF